MLCFPHYDATCASLRVERLSPPVALAKLLESGTRVVGARPTMRAVAHLLERVPCVNLRYCEGRKPLPILRHRVGGHEFSYPHAVQHLRLFLPSSERL